MPPISLVGIPHDASSSFLAGARHAPALIREALRSPAGNDWSERLHNVADPDTLRDVGDLVLANNASDRATIETAMIAVCAADTRAIALGGDHSVTYPILRALRHYHAPPTILQIDAHADLYDEFDGDRFSHACPFARIMEEELACRLVQVGIRTLTPHQREQSDRFAVQRIDMIGWTAGERPVIDGPVYITVDLDGLDPAFAPGVSHWEPGGLSVRDVITIIQGIRSPIIGADVVEYNPERDPTGITAAVAAKLVKELASAMTAR